MLKFSSYWLPLRDDPIGSTHEFQDKQLDLKIVYRDLEPNRRARPLIIGFESSLVTGTWTLARSLR